jgi:hypothetical protein
MHISATLTFPQRLRVERLVLEEGAVTVHACAASRRARSPMCGRSSRPAHGFVEAPRRVAGQNPSEEGVCLSFGQSARHRAKQASPNPHALVFSQQV